MQGQTQLENYSHADQTTLINSRTNVANMIMSTGTNKHKKVPKELLMIFVQIATGCLCGMKIVSGALTLLQETEFLSHNDQHHFPMTI